MSAVEAAERLKRDAESLLKTGRSLAGEYGRIGTSFRRLLLSDISLARVALIRGLVFLLLCALMVGTMWICAMVMLVVGLHQLGLPWVASPLLPLLASAAVGRYAWGVARKALAFADLDATRRQLADWFPPTQPISTDSPLGEENPGPVDPDDPHGTDAEVAPKQP